MLQLTVERQRRLRLVEDVQAVVQHPALDQREERLAVRTMVQIREDPAHSLRGVVVEVDARGHPVEPGLDGARHRPTATCA
jgi:hypothetical protein